MRIISIVSGGLDSVVMAHLWSAAQHEQVLVTFNYGQRHRKEIAAAEECAMLLGAEHILIDLSSVGRLYKSALTSPEVAVPLGHYEDATMRATVVPARNALFITAAYGLAVSRGFNAVSYAAHRGDHAVYPDCRPEFVAALERALQVGTRWDPEQIVPAVLSPFIGMSKADIVAEGVRLGVPLASTWSCYAGDARHCGKCGTCVERREAFQLAGVEDPTDYVDA